MKKMLSISLLAVTLVAQSFADPALPEPNKDDTNREVIGTYAEVYLREKNYVQAENSITQYIVSDAQDPKLWNLLGLAQLAQKKFGPAAYAFKKSADLFSPGEDQSNALYNFADALNQAQRTNESKQVLQAIIDRGGRGKSSAENALEKINGKEILPGQSLPSFVWEQKNKWRVSGALAFGYDTNVLLVDDLSASSGAVSGQKSAFVTPALQVGYWGTLANQRYDARFTTSFTDYFSTAAKTFNLLYERFDLMWGSGSTRLGMIEESTFLNRDPFQLYYLNAGLVLQKRARMSETVEWDFDLPIKYQYYYFDRAALSEDVRTGLDIAPKIQYLRVIGDDTRLASQLIFDNQITTGRNYRFSGIDFPTVLLVPIVGLKNWGLTNSFGVDVGGQYYWKSDQSRRDWNARLSLGLLKSFGAHFRASLDYSYQKNFSNLEVAKYQKHLIALTLGYDLL